MASPLRLMTSNLVTRSFRPTAFSASRFFSIDQSCTSMQTHDFYDQSWPRILCPEVPSMYFSMEMTAERRTLYLRMDEEESIELHMSGVKNEDMRACADQHNNMFICDKTRFANKEDILTNIIAKVVANFRDISTKRSWPYSDLLSDRSIIGKELCPVMEMMSPINIFSIYKEETAEKLYTGMNIYEHKEMKPTKQGLVVPLDFYQWKREDIKTFFDYNTFFIEGKRKNEHRIIGVRLPEGFHKKHSLVKREMDKLELSALLPTIKKEELKSTET